MSECSASRYQIMLLNYNLKDRKLMCSLENMMNRLCCHRTLKRAPKIDTACIQDTDNTNADTHTRADSPVHCSVCVCWGAVVQKGKCLWRLRWWQMVWRQISLGVRISALGPVAHLSVLVYIACVCVVTVNPIKWRWRLIVNTFECICMSLWMAEHLPFLRVEDVKCYVMLLVTSNVIALTD